MEYRFTYRDKVRDYECDIQGVVNNSVYQNYLEHARHEFLLDIGIDFSDLAKQGINLVVVRAEVDYKRPLTPGDKYWVGINTHRPSKLKFEFLQDIYKEGSDRPAIVAKITGVALNQQGKPCTLDLIDEVF